VDLTQPGAALLIERRGPDLLKKLTDHASDPHHLGWLLHHLNNRALPLALLTAHCQALGADHHNLRLLLVSVLSRLTHDP
jgi:hypothetical protein